MTDDINHARDLTRTAYYNRVEKFASNADNAEEVRESLNSFKFLIYNGYNAKVVALSDEDPDDPTHDLAGVSEEIAEADTAHDAINAAARRVVYSDIMRHVNAEDVAEPVA